MRTIGRKEDCDKRQCVRWVVGDGGSDTRHLVVHPFT